MQDSLYWKELYPLELCPLVRFIRGDLTGDFSDFLSTDFSDTGDLKSAVKIYLGG